MTQFFIVVIFLSCTLVPDGTTKFEVLVNPIDGSEQVIAVYEYNSKKRVWEVYAKGNDQEKAVFKLKGSKVMIEGEDGEKIDIREFLALNGKEDWSSIEEVPLQKNVSGPEAMETAILISRDLKNKKIILDQEIGEIAQVGKFEITW